MSLWKRKTRHPLYRIHNRLQKKVPNNPWPDLEKFVTWARFTDWDPDADKNSLLIFPGCDGSLVSHYYFQVFRKSDAPLYRVYQGIFERCEDPNRKEYPRYGGRGITVCEEWKNRESFVKWAKRSGWTNTKQMVVHRVGNDGPYSPDNCVIISKEAHDWFHAHHDRGKKFRPPREPRGPWSEEIKKKISESNRLTYYKKHGISLDLLPKGHRKS